MRASLLCGCRSAHDVTWHGLPILQTCDECAHAVDTLAVLYLILLTLLSPFCLVLCVGFLHKVGVGVGLPTDRYSISHITCYVKRVVVAGVVWW